MTNLPPLSLYIHIPWCIKKCPYCDFNSHTHAPEDFTPYLNAILEDLRYDLDYIQGREISTVFIGGGTPSLAPASFYHSLFEQLNQLLTFSDYCEITLEANPGASDADYFKGYKAAGINRISIGAQSFNNQHLKNLGRIHSNQAIFNAFKAARAAGFERINLDVIFGLSEQTLEQALDDLQTAIELNPEHLSWYQLTIEPNTYFGKHIPKSLPDDDALAEMYQAGLKNLQQAGYQQYEISAHSKDNDSKENEQCRHNVNYWKFGDYLALGAGAHGKITLAEDNSQQVLEQEQKAKKVMRYQKTRMPKDYLQRIGSRSSQVTQLDGTALFEEFFLNQLRLKDNCITQQSYENLTGLNFNALIEKIKSHPWLSTFLIYNSEQPSLQLSPKGYDVLDSILLELYQFDDNG